MNKYSDAARPFWLEAYGGRPYRVERQKHPEPINVPRNAVAVFGGTQPEKVAELFEDADDGLLSRLLWSWPDPIPFRLGRTRPAVATATEALDRLRCLTMEAGTESQDAAPIFVPLNPDLLPVIEAFGQDMQARQTDAAGLMRSAYGKARGMVLRLSLVLEMLRWCINPAGRPPPTEIGEAALCAACDLVADYFLPMAERVYGDAATRPAARGAATLARWIAREKPAEVHVRTLQREVRLAGLGSADAIHAAAAVLVDADWLRPPAPGGFQDRQRAAYAVNPALRERDRA
jgi:putative DNA primase/helicase